MKSFSNPKAFSDKWILLAVLFFSLGTFSCEQATENGSTGVPGNSLPAMYVPWSAQNSIICFGTSLTYGYGAGERTFFSPIWTGGSGMSPFVGDSSYPRFLKESLRINVINKGYVGARTAYGLSILNDSVLSSKPALILLEFGANEFLQGVNSHETDSVLSLLVQNILQSGSKVVLLSFIHPDMTNFMTNGYWTAEDSTRAIGYYTMLSNLSKRMSVPLVEYPLQGVFGHPSLMSDRFHPNGIGYLKMEQNIFQALRNTFEQNGMLK